MKKMLLCCLLVLSSMVRINAMQSGSGEIVKAKAIEEVEIKFQLDSSDFKDFLEWLESSAHFEKTVEIIDTYYNHPKKSFLFTTPNGLTQYKELLRIRNSLNGTNKICKKMRHYNQDFTKIIKTEESEEKIANVFAKNKELLDQGFQVLKVFEKTRKIYIFQDSKVELEIVIDEVQNFGRFLEIEVKKGSLTHEQLWSFLKTTGIEKYTAFNVGYLNIALNLEHNFGETKTL